MNLSECADRTMTKFAYDDAFAERLLAACPDAAKVAATIMESLGCSIEPDEIERLIRWLRKYKDSPNLDQKDAQSDAVTKSHVKSGGGGGKVPTPLTW